MVVTKDSTRNKRCNFLCVTHVKLLTLLLSPKCMTACAAWYTATWALTFSLCQAATKSFREMSRKVLLEFISCCVGFGHKFFSSCPTLFFCVDNVPAVRSDSISNLHWLLRRTVAWFWFHSADALLEVKMASRHENGYLVKSIVTFWNWYLKCLRLCLSVTVSFLSPCAAIISIEYAKNYNEKWTEVSTFNVVADSVIVLLNSACNPVARFVFKKYWKIVCEPESTAAQAMACVVTAVITLLVRGSLTVWMITSCWPISEVRNDSSFSTLSLFIKVISSFTLALYEVMLQIEKKEFLPSLILHTLAAFANFLCANSIEEWLTTSKNAEFFDHFGIYFKASLLFMAISINLSWIARLYEELSVYMSLWLNGFIRTEALLPPSLC